MRSFFTSTLLLLCSLGAFAAHAGETDLKKPLGLWVNQDGVLIKDGKPYRAMGINYYSAFLRKLHNPADTSYREGFKVLAQHNIPYVRVLFGGMSARDFKLYRKDKEAYFRLMDDVVKAAEEEHIGLIPSLIWTPVIISDVAGEHVDQWGNPKSKTIAFMRRYVADIATRYKDSPALWGYEMGNEYNLYTDLPNAADSRPRVHILDGSVWWRTKRDDMKHPALVMAYVEFATQIRRIDPLRIIVTGNSVPRPFAYHNSLYHEWIKDTRNQFAEMLLRDNPDPINTICVHLYPEVDETPFFTDRKGVSYNELLKEVTAIAKLVKKPVYVGEFGASNKQHGKDKVREIVPRMIKAIEDNDIPISALWVFDFGGQDNDWNITETNERGYLLDLIGEANARMQKKLNAEKQVP